VFKNVDHMARRDWSDLSVHGIIHVNPSAETTGCKINIFLRKYRHSFRGRVLDAMFSFAVYYLRLFCICTDKLLFYMRCDFTTSCNQMKQYYKFRSKVII